VPLRRDISRFSRAVKSASGSGSSNQEVQGRLTGASG